MMTSKGCVRNWMKESIKYKKNHAIYIHGRKAYFENKYTL